jgi:hypothetical protein
MIEEYAVQFLTCRSEFALVLMFLPIHFSSAARAWEPRLKPPPRHLRAHPLRFTLGTPCIGS